MKISVLFSLALIAAGCAQPQPLPTGASAVMQCGPLTMTVSAPKHNYRNEKVIPLTVVVRNTSGDPVTVQSRGSDLVQFRIYRKTLVGWEQVLQYPRASLDVLTPWTLEPRAERTWKVDLPIEPTWPVDEALRIVTVLNGQADLAPAVVVRILPAS